MASNTQIKQLADRANKLEAGNKRKAAEKRITTDKAYGFTAAFLTSAVAGYVDGRFDLSDGEAGDGTTLFGVPVVPIAAGIIAVGGMAVGGKGGSAMAYAGLGAACGWSYSRASRAGVEAESK